MSDEAKREPLTFPDVTGFLEEVEASELVKKLDPSLVRFVFHWHMIQIEFSGTVLDYVGGERGDQVIIRRAGEEWVVEHALKGWPVGEAD